MALTPNSPRSRFAHVVATYWGKKYDPSGRHGARAQLLDPVVIDVFSITRSLVGAEDVSDPSTVIRHEFGDLHVQFDTHELAIDRVQRFLDSDGDPESLGRGQYGEDRIRFAKTTKALLAQLGQPYEFISGRELRSRNEQSGAPRSKLHEATRPRGKDVYIDWDAEQWGLADLMSKVAQLPEQAPADFLVPWIARELVKLAKAVVDEAQKVHRDEAYGMEAYSAVKKDYSEAVKMLYEKGPAIAQWAKESKTDIGKVDLAKALSTIATYKFKQALVKPGVVVYEFDDGWTVQDLREDAALTAEGKIMQHCVGSYCSKVKEGTSRIYSLRDPSGNPHVTLEWAPATGDVRGGQFGKYAEPGDPEWDEYVALSPQDFLRSRFKSWGSFEQIYGKQNAAPAKQYIPYVREFIEQRFNGDVKALLSLDIPLQELDLRGKDLRDMLMTERQVGELVGLDFTGSDLTNANFSQNTIGDCTFDGCDLTDAELRACYFVNTTFVEANLTRAIFDDSRFHGTVSLRDADVTSASFEGVPDNKKLLKGTRWTGMKGPFVGSMGSPTRTRYTPPLGPSTWEEETEAADPFEGYEQDDDAL